MLLHLVLMSVQPSMRCKRKTENAASSSWSLSHSASQPGKFDLSHIQTATQWKQSIVNFVRQKMLRLYNDELGKNPFEKRDIADCSSGPVKPIQLEVPV